jgi:hypothetical protein
LGVDCDGSGTGLSEAEVTLREGPRRLL